jgi:tetratricopeptide (TPR) repeat protein
MKPIIVKGLWLLLLFIAGITWGTGNSRAQTKSPEVNKALELLVPPSPENFEKSHTRISDILNKNPQDVEAQMGLVYLRLTEYAFSPSLGTGGLLEALKLVDAALKIRPDLEDAYRKKSLVLFSLGRKEEGLSVLESSLRKWPGSLDLQEAYLAYLLSLGKVKEAERFSELQAPQVKNKREALLRLGKVWLQAGYGDQSDDCFGQSLHLGETPQGWAGLGRAVMLKKDYTTAIEFFQRALTLDSKYYEIYADLAFCYFQLGQPREAIRWMEPYCQAFPNDLAALGNLAGLYEGAGDKIRARLAWMKVRANTWDPQQARLAGERLEKLREQK